MHLTFDKKLKLAGAALFIFFYLFNNLLAEEKFTVTAGHKLILLTLNAQRFSFSGKDFNQSRLDKLSEIISSAKNKNEDSDLIIFLQEISSAPKENNIYFGNTKYYISYSNPDNSIFGLMTLSTISPLETESLIAESKTAGIKRNVIKTSFKIDNLTSLNTYNVHLPQNKINFKVRAEILSDLVKISGIENGNQFAIIAGDLNFTQEEWKVSSELKNKETYLASSLYNNQNLGTYFYKPGKLWSFFDNFLISENLSISNIEILNAWPFQLDQEKGPARYNRKDSTGFSDHFPLQATVEVHKEIKGRAKLKYMSLPKDTSLFKFTKDTLVPFFEKINSQQPEVSTSDLKLIFLEKLSQEGLQVFYDIYKKNIAEIKKSITEELSKLNGRKIILNEPVIRLEPGYNESSVSSAFLALLTKFVLFEHGLGIYLENADKSLQILFLPISRNNLRAYSGYDDANLRDLSYQKLCQFIDNGINKEEYSLLLSSFIKTVIFGFNQEFFNGLSKKESLLLLDLSGIYISEYYKRIKLNLSPGQKDWMSGHQLLNNLLFVSFAKNGGLMLEPDLLLKKGEIKNKNLFSPACAELQANYGFRCCTRTLNEVIFSNYLEKKYPELTERVRASLECYNNNIFRCLSDRIENYKVITAEDLQIFHEIIANIEKDNFEIIELLKNLSDKDIKEYEKKADCISFERKKYLSIENISSPK